MDMQGLLFQTRDPLLKDVRIRRAIALALDMPELVATVTTGNAEAEPLGGAGASPYYKRAQAALPSATSRRRRSCSPRPATRASRSRCSRPSATQHVTDSR